MQSRWVNRVASLFPYIMLVIAGLAVSLTLVIRRFELTVFSLVVVIPLILAGIILLSNKKINVRDLSTHASKLQLLPLFLFNSLIFIISIIILVAVPIRPLAYFVIVSIYAGVILLQVLCQRPKWTDNLVILQIVMLSLNLIWGVTLKYPLYFGDTDLLIHMNLIDTILKTGYVDPLNSDYLRYPLYHIFTAMGVEITGASLRSVVFIIMGLAWQAVIVFSFLIFRKLSNSSKFAAIACLFFALSSQIIFYGSYSIARSLAFLFLLAWLYLVFDKAQKDTRYLFLSLIILAAMIATHHLNVLWVIPILLVFYVCQLLINRFRQDRLLELPFFYLLTIAAISYLVWFAYGLANSNLLATVQALINLETSIKGSAALTHGFGLSVFMGTLYYSFVLILCLLGMKIVFDHAKLSDARQKAAMFSFAGFLTLVVYIPGFLYLLPLSDILLTDRLTLIVSPFASFLMAYGITYLYSLAGTPQLKPGRRYPLFLPLILVVAMTFFSVTSIGNAKDTNYFPHTSTVDSPYFNEPELDSFLFLNNKSGTRLPLYGDYPTVRSEFLLGDFEDRGIVMTGDFSYIREGYLVLRIGEAYRKQSASFSPDGEGRVLYRYPSETLSHDLDVLADSPSGNKIYSNRDVYIYIVRNPDGR